MQAKLERQLSQEEKLAKRMTGNILMSLSTPDNPMAILIESYIQKQLETYRDEILELIEGDPSAIDTTTYEEWEADRYYSEDDVNYGC